MRKLRRVNLAGYEFTIQNRKVQMRRARFTAWANAECDRDDLFRKYKKPSSIKLAIWHDWCDWAKDFGYAYIQVRGASPNFFSIEGLSLVGDTWYYVEITHTHNYLYPIEIIEDEIQ
jgi:hypothetical protein